MNTTRTRKFLPLIIFVLCQSLILTSCGSPGLLSTPTPIPPTDTPTPIQPTEAPTPTTTPTRKPTQEPFLAMNIVNEAGRTTAEIYATNGTVGFDQNGNWAAGSGFIQALPGNFYRIWIPIVCNNDVQMLDLRVDRIEWDDQGRTIEVTGLHSGIEGPFGNVYLITSELEHPAITDGVLWFTVHDKGEFGVRTWFGGLQPTFLEGGDCEFIEQDGQP